MNEDPVNEDHGREDHGHEDPGHEDPASTGMRRPDTGGRMPRNIVVLGAGAIGCNVCTDLARAGHAPVVVDPWPAQVEALRTRGLKITLPDGEEHAPPIDAVHLCDFASHPRTYDTYDVALIAMKSQDAHWMAEFVLPHLASDAVVVGLMNGMNDDAIASVVGRERTVGACIELAAELFVPGETRRKTPRSRTWFALGELDGTITPRLAMLRELLSCAAQVATTTNIRGAKWTKLVTNSMVLSPFAMLGVQSYEATQNPEIFDLIRRIGRETIEVGNAHGFRLEPIFGLTADEFGDSPAAIVDKLVTTLVGHIGRNSRNTAFQDVLKKRRTETDYINGLVVKLGREAGIPTPGNQAVCDIVHRIERGELGPSVENMGLVDGDGDG
jgi:2-dehydropantoate 2-reductase